jgi:hypothetical protein
VEYAAPLPDFSRVMLAGTFQLGGRTCRLEISPIRRFPDYGPDYDVVQCRVLLDDQPLTLADLNPQLSVAECYHLWSDLCAALQEAVRTVYALPATEGGEPNPRLGCWGHRPDLRGQGDSDCYIALVLGVAVDTRPAGRRPSQVEVARALAAALLAALRRWEAAARA